MARPIEATPPIVGEDADRLLEQLAQVAPPEEIERRRQAARRHLAEVTRPKHRPAKLPPVPVKDPPRD